MSSPESPKPLYQSAGLYGRVFPVEDGDIDFFARLLSLAVFPEGPLVDLGSGTGDLAVGLERRLRRPVIAVDREAALLAAGRKAARSIQGDLHALPLRDCSAAATVCRLFGLAYSMGASWREEDPAFRIRPLAEALRILAPGGLCAWELPMAHHPAGLQGMEESAEVEPGLVYTFRYLDVLVETRLGAILDTAITVGRAAALRAPLHVFRPPALAQWLEAAGGAFLGFFPSGDAETMVAIPPADCLRGVILFQRALMASNH